MLGRFCPIFLSDCRTSLLNFIQFVVGFRPFFFAGLGLVLIGLNHILWLYLILARFFYDIRISSYIYLSICLSVCLSS